MLLLGVWKRSKTELLSCGKTVLGTGCYRNTGLEVSNFIQELCGISSHIKMLLRDNFMFIGGIPCIFFIRNRNKSTTLESTIGTWVSQRCVCFYHLTNKKMTATYFLRVCIRIIWDNPDKMLRIIPGIFYRVKMYYYRCYY
jgi:hypothetical protein